MLFSSYLDRSIYPSDINDGSLSLGGSVGIVSICASLLQDFNPGPAIVYLVFYLSEVSIWRVTSWDIGTNTAIVNSSPPP